MTRGEETWEAGWKRGKEGTEGSVEPETDTERGGGGRRRRERERTGRVSPVVDEESGGLAN